MTKVETDQTKNVSETLDLAQKLVEIASILESDPVKMAGALSVALGLVCGTFDLDTNQAIPVVDTYARKSRDMIKKEMGATSAPRATLIPTKVDGDAN